MKKRIAFLVMLITIASSQIAAADTGVVAGSGLRVRQNSSLSSTISGYLNKDTKVEILGKQGQFYKIAYKGKTGYVHSSYINVVKSTTAVSESGDSVQASILEKQGETTADYLNVRSGAGLSYSVNGVLKRGSKVTIYEKTNGFYKIMYNGKTSYVSSLYVAIVEYKTVTASNNSTSTSISRGAVSTPQIESTGVGTVTASDFLNVRGTASISNNILGKVYPNNKVLIYGTEGYFYKIKYASGWGYIYKSYVSVVNNAKQANTQITGDMIITYASKFLGIPYIWGGTTPLGFDCSGYVQYVYKNFDINLPRVTMDQVNVGTAVNINDLQKGDLIYFRTNTSQPSQVSHVGIYIGDNKFMQAPKTGDIIRISELTGYYRDNFVIGRRMID
ncbi:SH3 domain-containing protein [Clostridium sp.]|uniref:C40 family peptidase n=1 Tax=Clostridium sp. TaxID=1506 RepID=UPI001A60249A|nr:SH3 domain-containing protein [Clostridium sp.]MBK5239615.1 SH3 domain-containing protein [Clostridium sp.]